LPENFVLLTRGEKGQPGYMQIILKKKDGGRNLKMTVNGENKEAVWESPTIFEKNKQYYFIMGITNAS
jgi:hypothetical protein